MKGDRDLPLQTVYLLHSRPYRENSLLLNLLSAELGHISAVAYAGSSRKNSKKAQLQPFSVLEVQLKVSGSMYTLSQIESATLPLPLSRQFLYSGFYLNELCVRLLPQNISCDPLFEQYHQALQQLNNQQSIEPILRKFEFSLLEELGLGIDFSVLETEPGVAERDSQYWYYLPEQGLIPADYQLQADKFCYQHLIAIRDGKLQQSDVLLTCKALMRQVFKPLLGNRPLQSRKLFAYSKR
ncbi:DNA repair protein RecO [Thalassotalea mangrovi]|uniref:DNA repair protein RecO n=1 Tax=Thalassotalea mangrovi TaxID=2572245 RepID=A0A4V5NUE8_9GAMM|nr:DNA repair protein RecO [Thalassotalea mangrovi]TKB46176.1 DNA repair protein RecO [Thalassotalea mangrovi]